MAPPKKERTTSEVAEALGVLPRRIKNWKHRGRLPLAPKGGIGFELYWSEEAFQQVLEYAENRRLKKVTLKTHCKRGHEFTPENIYMDRKGARQCRICMKIRKQRERRCR